MINMLLLDVFVRYSTVTMLFLSMIFALRDGRKSPQAIYIVLVTVSVGFMLLGTARPELQLPAPLHDIVRFGDCGNNVFIWWFGLSIFQDEFRLKWPHWLALIVVLLVLMPARAMELYYGQNFFPPVLDYSLDALTVVMMGHLIYVIFKGRADDLVESRRRVRLYFIIGLITATLAAAVIENSLNSTNKELLSTLRGVIIFPMALFGLLWLLQWHPEKLEFEKSGPRLVNSPNVDPRDQSLLEQLTAAMEADKIYEEPGLTIRTLAEALKAPEHRLRALINQGLGYRNFSAFLNGYRIEAVKSAFADPAMSRIPVLTIAMDVGFNSLAPFNRAIRDREGMTPSAYRQKNLGEDV